MRLPCIDDFTHVLKNSFKSVYKRKKAERGVPEAHYSYPWILQRRGELRAGLGDLSGAREDLQEVVRTYELENLHDEALSATYKLNDLELNTRG